MQTTTETGSTTGLVLENEAGNLPAVKPARAGRKQGAGQMTAAPPMTPMEMIGSAVARGASVEEIDKLMALAERMEAKQAKQAYVEAMARFKQNPPTIIKNKTAKMQKDGRDLYSYGFADLAAVCGGIVEALANVGISHSWTTAQASGQITVTCTLTHALGHSESTSLSAGADQSGGKNSVQAIGSTVKYLERYTLLAITGIAVQDGEDDDGAGASPAERSEMRQAASDMRQGANKDPGPAPAQLLNDARTAADGGRDQFGVFWKGLNGVKRNQLAPHLAELQARADKVDGVGK